MRYFDHLMRPSKIRSQQQVRFFKPASQNHTQLLIFLYKRRKKSFLLSCFRRGFAVWILLFQLQSHQLEGCSSDTPDAPSVNQLFPPPPAADKPEHVLQSLAKLRIARKILFVAECLCGKNKVQNSLHSLSHTKIHFPVASLPKKVSIRKYLVFYLAIILP